MKALWIYVFIPLSFSTFKQWDNMIVKALTTILLSSLLSAINAVLNHVSVVAVDCV